MKPLSSRMKPYSKKDREFRIELAICFYRNQISQFVPEKFPSAAKTAVKKREEEQQSKWVLNKEHKGKDYAKHFSFFGRKNREKRRDSVSDITKHYRLLLSEFVLDYHSISRVRKCELLEKLIGYFGDKVKVINHTVEGVGQNIFKSDLSVDKALLTTFDTNISSDYKVKTPLNFSRF